MSSRESSEVWEMEVPSLEAKEVYVVMQNNYRISRNIRAQWFFKNLNKTLAFKWKTSQEECLEEIEIISAIPKVNEKFAVDPETNTSVIKIVSETKIHFLSTQYRLAFCLDLSNSISTVDIQHDNILYEEIFLSLEQSLTNVTQPFIVPGSNYCFSPQIYITVIAHIPNCSSTVPQALIQGWILTPANVSDLLSYLRKKLEQMCKLVRNVSSVVSDEQIQFMMSHDAAGAMLDSTIEGNKMIKKVLDLSADISTLKLIQYGILALQLLPENSSAGIVVLTDGILNFPTCKSLDSILTQLRNSTISCSFIQLGSPFHSFSCFGRVPYKELMEFFATATCGAFFPSRKNSVEIRLNSTEINNFHKALLLWNFQKTSTSGFLEAYEPSPTTKNYWHVENPHFYTVAHQSRVKKKHTEGTWKVSLENLLSCRLREGYSVKSVLIDEAKNTQEIRLVLPWMLSTNIEYLITSGPSPGRHWKNSSSELSSCHFEIIVDGCYEFLHDVTCSDKKPIKSVYRKTVITQFWSYIKNLSNTDQILTQLHSFALNPIYYTIPESIKNGVPLFYFSTTSAVPILQSTNSGNMQFASFWKPLCMLDINVWQKWMHAHRIGVILQHDTPLQKNLHLPNSSGRYAHVQCRQAITTLNSLLSEESSFVLVENHSYINLLFEDPDKPPVSFYVIRVTSKPPCVVIRLAFLGGLPGSQRYKIVNDLREKILNLKLAKRSSGKDYTQSLGQHSSTSEQCCYILKKPVEKILIRYERLPTNFLISLPDSQGNTRNIPFHQKQTDAYFYADALATLSKYLLQQRWIWTLQYESCSSLDLKSASKILYTLTKIRLLEGFHFSHSNFGIVYLVQEIPMEVPKGITLNSDDMIEKESNCCVFEYVIFPPHTNTTVKDSISEEDDTELTEADGELQLIAECWVEPQYGTTVMSSELEYLNGLTYEQLPAAIHKKDMEVIKVLTTFEHLCSVCQKSLKLIGEPGPGKSTSTQVGQLLCGITLQPLPSVTITTKTEPIDPTNTTIVPYAFSLMSLLPRCPQTQMVFSTLHEAQVSHIEVGSSGNVLFFDFLIENLKYFHDQEISLTLEDCEIYLYQIHHRNTSSLPFPHPEFRLSEQLFQESFSVNLSDCDICCSGGSKPSDANRQCLPENKKDCIPRWRCFVKGCSSSHIIITLVPATYDDLKKLHFPNIFNKNALENEMPVNSDAPTSIVDSSELSELSSSENLNCEDEQVPIENSDINSLVLPIFVYNCVSSAIVNQLVQSHNGSKIIDRHENHLFECECHPDANMSSYATGIYKEAEVKKTVDVHLWKEHCCLIEKAFSKAFVYGVYRSLMNDFSIQKCDAVAAIDNICEESLLEIDITEFIFMICGHVKDFFTKQSVRQMHFSQESNEENVTSEENATDEATDQERPLGKSFFPMSILEKYQPCEELHQKHLSVKEKFSEIIRSYFKVIPSRPDYFFFCPVDDDEIEDVSIINEVDESQEEDALSESVVVFEGENAEGELDKVNNVIKEDEDSKSCFNTNSSVSSIGKDTEPSSLQDRSTFPPLIVHFSCSVRGSKQELKSCPLALLPTCLNDIIKCLDPANHEISLEDLRITLDMYCLTVPNDVENPEISRHRVYSTSFSSNSPVPEAESYKRAVKDDDNESNCSDIPTDTLQAGSLFNLPSFQREAVFRCIDKVKWLLQDEKVSIALNCFPITCEALDMVIDHVKSSKEKPCCIIKNIPLMFVYGVENSLDKFTQAFKRMSPVGYRLEEVAGRYYLVIDGEAEQRSNSEAPLGIAQFNILKGIPHSDDGTELKRIAEEMKDTPVFLDKDFQRNDDHQGSEVENEVFSLSRDKIPHHLGQEEDSETEDGTENAKPKARFRKTSVKRLGACVHTCQRKCNSSLWETERKKGRSKKASKCIACKRGIGLDTDVVNKDGYTNIAAEEVHNSEDTPPVDENTPDASLDVNFAQDTSIVPNSRLKTSDSDDPTADKDAEYGKFLSSNTEDGYDGDSSDSGSDDLINSIDTRRPVLPRFWLIMQICDNNVIVYFHMRNRSDEDPELIQCKSVLNEVVTIIAKICKEVNQILLLKSLWDVRMCDRLLVAEENEDMWKTNDPNRTLSNDDPDLLLDVQEKCLIATLKFEPGFFGCPIVWVTHFRLHHRLAVTATGTHRSCGMQALRSVLNTFSVNNRENMFVYQESSGKVFYIRIFEEYCDVDHQRNGDDMSLVDRYSSMQSLPTKGTLSEIDLENDFRPRVNSGASDSYRQDSISTTSASRRHQKCVAMYVHGIGEVGTDIRKDLVQVLQNRLNEGVLDQINMMFCRNPSCMLTPEDVQFIQNPNSPPAHELFFTLPVKLLEYAHAIHVYLRQNLLHFLYTPKYTDNKKETHFKVYWDNPQEWAQTDDNDIFIYHPQQALSRPGGKGIACVILSLVTGQGKPFHTLEAQSPNPSAYLDGLVESEHCDLTAISCYDPKNERSPGPVALVRYQLWHVGKDNIEYLKVQLKDAITHALWDLLLEYRALTSPTSESAFFDDSVCYSEPTTPIRMRRSGLVNVDSGLQLKDLHSSVKLHSSKEMSSSVPDMTTKTHSSSPLLKDVPAFNFGNKGPLSAKPEFNTQVTNLNSQLSVPTASKCDKKNLNPMFHTSLKSFLEFGDKLGCSNLSRSVHILPSRHCMNYVLKEITKIVKIYLRDLAPRVYIKTTDSLLGNIEYIPYDPTDHNTIGNETRRPGAVKDFIMVGRNERQWRSYMGLDDFSKFHEICFEGVKSYQKHLTHICDHRSIESFPESIPSSPTFVNKSASSVTSSSPNLKGYNAHSSEIPNSLVPIFVPRQRLFLVYVEDKKMTVYLYNWAQDLTINIVESITRLNKWHHHRSSLLNNILLQKVGLFQGVEMLRRSDVEKSSKDSKSSVLKRTVDEPVQSTTGYVEQLVRSHAFIGKDTPSGSTSSRFTGNSKSSLIVRNMKNVRPRVPFHLSPQANMKDPVLAHGSQYLELITPHRRDLHSLFALWHTRGGTPNFQPSERMFHDLRRQARLGHYCLTPLLFSPSWRHKVAPIRDHGLEPLDQLTSSMERAPEVTVSSRSRHSSGSSLKTSEFSSSGNSMTRTRRMSGAAGYPSSNQGSPKMRSKTSSEETWHSTVCHHYLQEYIQYLHTVGFVLLQTSEIAEKKFSNACDDDKLSRSDSFSRHRNSARGSPNYLLKFVLGGLLIFELGLNEPYAYGYLYTMERKRFHACNSRCLIDNKKHQLDLPVISENDPYTIQKYGSQFLDDIDKVIMDINLHSFTYDYHLRTIHSYISGRQLIFRHGYHLTSFLDDFMKYYQKVPTGARNSVFTGCLDINEVNMSGDQLYNYIISHNKLYGMTVLRMVPVVFDNNSSIDTEFALVELTQQMASYKDQNDDTCKIGSFDVGILINQKTSDPDAEPNSLILTLYIILTSQRELYPKQLSACGTFGSFQTVRFGTSMSSGFSSRKTSTVSTIIEREKFESSGEESVNSTDSGPRTKRVSIVRSMCDEDVLYLGYFSSQETMMQQVLKNQADTAKIHLKEIVEKAAFDCRRDFLWSSLLPRSLKEENSSKDHGLSSYAEFTELLGYITIQPLNSVDERLNPLMIMHISWYTTLASVLKTKYADSHREFVSPDNNSLYVAVTNQSCPDVFIMLTVDTRANRSNLCLVFREPPSSASDDDKSDKHAKSLQSVIEDFVNACCFHLWTCILTP